MHDFKVGEIVVFKSDSSGHGKKIGSKAKIASLRYSGDDRKITADPEGKTPGNTFWCYVEDIDHDFVLLTVVKKEINRHRRELRILKMQRDYMTETSKDSITMKEAKCISVMKLMKNSDMTDEQKAAAICTVFEDANG